MERKKTRKQPDRLKRHRIGKRQRAKRQRSHVNMTHLTISIPSELATFIKTKPNYSGVIASLIAELKIKEEGMPEPTVSLEEKEIRQALKEREQLDALYPNLIGVIERAIKSGRDLDKWAKEEEDDTLKDWHEFVSRKGVHDQNGYFEIFNKYNGQNTDESLNDLWRDVQNKIEIEREKEHEARLKREVAPGMTFQDAMDKLDIYLKVELDKKIKELMAERDAIKDDDTGAGPYIRRKEITEKIEALKKRFENKEVRMKDIINALGLPYMEVYNKVAPLLRQEGYKIITD